jgi:CubicO group peptidase (beta-lactamase class C family)
MRRSAVALLIAALLLVRVPAGADELALELFGRYLDALARQVGIPGLAAAVVGEGGIAWERGFGMQDVERSIAVRPDTPFHVDGLTQTFTAAISLRCAEEGRLALDGRVAQFDGSSPEPDATVRQLLSHTSGAPDALVFAYRPDRLAPLWRGVRMCAVNSYRETLTNLLNRLAMRDSVPGPNAVSLAPGSEGMFDQAEIDHYRGVLERLAVPYAVDKRGRATRSHYVATELSPSAGLIASVRDLAQFDIALRRGVLLRPETLEAAWRNPVDRAGQPLPHGLGWFSQIYNGELVVWQFGMGENASSSLVVSVPGRGLTFIALANSDGLVRSFPLAAGDVTVSPVARTFLRVFVG